MTFSELPIRWTQAASYRNSLNNTSSGSFMRHSAAVLAILLSFLAAGATAADTPQVNKWFAADEFWSPLPDTHIQRFTDVGPGYVVHCYVYTPHHIATKRSCGPSGCATDFDGDIGSISCVNVTPQVQPTAAPTAVPQPSQVNGKKQN